MSTLVQVVILPHSVKILKSLLFLTVSLISKHRGPFISPTPALKNSPVLCFSKIEFRLCFGISTLLQ